MSAVSVLAEGGIIGAEDVVSIAAAAGLELAAAATLLVKESSGGRNVWGHDAVTVAPNTYVKGGPVTQSNYTAYRAAVNAGHAGRQGCGPTQRPSPTTSPPPCGATASVGPPRGRAGDHHGQ